MHVVHLGVMKKLVSFWIKLLNKEQLKTINTRIEIAEKCRPSEIHRHIRNICEVNQFKASEFRTFLLFTGPYLMKDILEARFYKHFLLLNFAMKKLCNQTCTNDITSIRSLLDQFVREFKDLYGLNKLTYVVHSLIHICDDVERYGCTQNFSAYKYENNNGKITRNMRHAKNVECVISSRKQVLSNSTWKKID